MSHLPPQQVNWYVMRLLCGVAFVARLLCPQHGVQSVVAVCVHVAESFHRGNVKPPTRKVGVPFIKDSKWSILLCPSCMKQEGLEDRDQIWPASTDEEFDQSFERWASVFDRVGQFVCWQCWKGKWGEAC
jgi:hypothetical protein